jgi:hypothetical protein
MKDVLLIIIVTLLAILFALKDQERFAVLNKDFRNRLFVSCFVTVVFFATSGLLFGDDRLKSATKSAIIGFMIAYLAHLNMSFAVFFLVGIFVYYNGGHNYM